MLLNPASKEGITLFVCSCTLLFITINGSKQNLNKNSTQLQKDIPNGCIRAVGNFRPGIAGAVFGAGWWFWVDAVVCSSVTVSFLHYLPGIFASFAALMFNCVNKEDIDYSPYDDGDCRLKLWLFFAYVVSFVSLAASVGLLIQDSIGSSGPSVWTGTAGIFQCVFVLISGLVYWTVPSE